MPNYINNHMGNNEDWRVRELMNLPEEDLDFVDRVQSRHKVKALVRASAIMHHDLVANAALMCQGMLEEKVSMIIQRNPAAERNIRELAAANMLYLRDKIYDPRKG